MCECCHSSVFNINIFTTICSRLIIETFRKIKTALSILFVKNDSHFQVRNKNELRWPHCARQKRQTIKPIQRRCCVFERARTHFNNDICLASLLLSLSFSPSLSYSLKCFTIPLNFSGVFEICVLISKWLIWWWKQTVHFAHTQRKQTSEFSHCQICFFRIT